MKLGMVGTGGTGKTTTAKLLEPFTGLTYHPSVPRSVFEELGYTEADQRNMGRHDRWRIQKMIFDRKIQQDHQFPEGIFDRTLVDHVAYCLYQCNDSIDDTMYRSMMLLAQENSVKYDFILYFPIYDWDVKDDGLRDNKLAYRGTIDAIMLGILRKLEISYLVMADGSPDQRVQSILDLLKEGGRLRRVMRSG